VGAALVGAACGQPARSPKAGTPAALIDHLADELLARDPSYARSIGLHEADGKVAHYSAESLAGTRAFLTKALADLNGINESALSENESLDRAILKAHFSRWLFSLEDLDEPRKKPQFYEDIFSVNVYVDRDYAPLESRLARLVEHEEAALAEVPHIRENLALPLSKTMAKVAGKNYLGYAEYLRGDVAKIFGKVGDAALHARFEKANAALATEAEKLGKWLKDEVSPKGDESHILGAARFQKLFAVQEGLTSSIDELSRMAEADLARNKAAYEEIAKTTKLTRPAAAELIPLATGLVAESRQFLLDKKIVTIPSTDTAIVKETPPYAQWNAASLDATGPFDPYRAAFYYITLPNPSWSQKEQEEYVFPRGVLLATTVHEVFPGHFLQGRWAERAPTRVQKLSGSYSFTEGWAHYVEQMMIEEGFHASDPQARLGQLSDALLRNCRFVGAIALHAQSKSVEEVARRFATDCKQDAATAQEQAERGTFDPGYFAYTLGKIQILELRAEAKQKLGASFSLQKFHDALLAHGAPPVALLRPRVLAAIGAH
jgi:uncharacterized protein (DUF885 family)